MVAALYMDSHLIPQLQKGLRDDPKEAYFE